MAGAAPGRRGRGGPGEGPSGRGTVGRRASGADLLVVGSRGQGRFAGLVLGSISQAMLHQAPCPLVVVRTSPGTPHRG
ncbi:universal stress protein [Nonomuraea dietziae]|uniref:universal stress protein n=1 Tax=Nonomuraea dietziae TaxID=65515 RepID=UPI0031D57B17